MPRKEDTILFWMVASDSYHMSAWRLDGPPRDTEMDFDLIHRQVQTAERGKFHGLFLADTLAFGLGSAVASPEAVSRTSWGSRWEPVTLLSALAACTKNIGLLGTVSTTYAECYNVARMFASLDHISGGRAGWNVVTSAHLNSGLNFGLEDLMAHAERYERGQEFFDVVAGLWDSWEDDAFVRDKASGRYFDPAKLHALNHRGKHLSVAGPLNIARPPQGYPVIAQAGSSTPGRAFAARNADVVYTLQSEIKHGKEFYDDIKAQAAGHGRNPDHVKVLPALFLAVGHSQAHAEEKLARLDALVDPVFGMEMLTAHLRTDLSGYPLDGPVPELPETEVGGKTGHRYWLDIAKRDNLTIRQLMQVAARTAMVPGTATTIADTIHEWIEAGAADGFNITFDINTDSLEIFVEEVIPELQRRGLFQTEYRGKTLRENLGLPLPPNRYVTRGKAASGPSRAPAKSALAN